jgi:hypothetical protein
MSILKEGGACKFCKKICCNNCIMDSYICAKCIIKVCRIQLKITSCKQCETLVSEKYECTVCGEFRCIECNIKQPLGCKNCNDLFLQLSSTEYYKTLKLITDTTFTIKTEWYNIPKTDNCIRGLILSERLNAIGKRIPKYGVHLTRTLHDGTFGGEYNTTEHMLPENSVGNTKFSIELIENNDVTINRKTLLKIFVEHKDIIVNYKVAEITEKLKEVKITNE